MSALAIRFTIMLKNTLKNNQTAIPASAEVAACLNFTENNIAKFNQLTPAEAEKFDITDLQVNGNAANLKDHNIV